MRWFGNTRVLRALALSITAVVASGATLAAAGDEELPPLLDPKKDKPGLNVGEIAPDAVVIDAGGREVRLKDLYPRAKQTVVMFYRGGWCPYCTRSLKTWAQEMGRFQEREIQVIAISPETAEHAADTQKAQNVGFRVFVDESTEAMRRYKVAFAVDSDYTDMLRKRLDVELSDWNASGEEILPAPATYLIDAQGKILWRHADWKYENRASPDDVLVAADEQE